MKLYCNGKLTFSILVITCLALSQPLFSQSSTISIIGTVLEENTQRPVEFATVLIADSNTKKPISGTTTLENGNFTLETNASNFYIEVSFMGFVTKTFEESAAINGTIDLGTVGLSENSQQLDEVVLTGEVSQTIFKLDKRVFNVGKDLSSTGASALEVLNNVPSVNVNIEGQISLRGSQGVQILINGKPSMMASEQGNALGTLTADMIQKIEVITNPSAKYDAEGTSGIINIVLKKEEKKGINGSVTLNTGVPNNHSVGLSLNKRTEKFNLFSQLGFGRRTFPSKNESENIDLVNNTSVYSIGESDKNETFFNVILGTDYHIDENNVLTLSGHFAYEWEKEHSDTDFSFFDAANTQTDGYRRTELTTATNPKYQYELQYKRDFERHEDQSLLFSALGNFFGKDQVSAYNNSTTLGTNANTEQQTRTDFKEAEYTFKLDYTHPFLEKYTIETGAQYVVNDVTSDYAVSDLVGGVWLDNSDLTNVFEYIQNVLGLYGTGAYEGDKWGIKLGLRLENTDLETVLQNTNENNSRNYTNLFPSGHTSFKVSDNFSLQAGYSKRIARPSLWDLNPFVNIRNNFSISSGNPNVQPEYTDSYEITSIHNLGKASINWAIFHRHTQDVIEDVTVFENNVSTSRPENVGINNAIGVELNAKFSPFKWFILNNDFNYNSFNREGIFNSESFDFKGNRWSSRLTGKFKLPASIDMEITGDYRSKYQTIQQEISDNLFANFGLRKKVFKGRVVLNLSIRDVFASRVFESITEQTEFYLYNRRERGRFVTFGISYGFGKGEAMEFSGQKRF
ncbi:MAG: TonB-dependent receptor [Flavobacteriaceae bacterium]|nr:MAG: TonB-dependent receptor [Flavobacteriaceae bacterium]